MECGCNYGYGVMPENIVKRMQARACFFFFEKDRHGRRAML